MGLSVNDVYLGLPDQSLTTGAVQTAEPLTGMTNGAVTLDARTALASAAWGTGSGYVSEAGVTLSQNKSTSKLRDWSRSGVRTLLDSFDGTVRYAELQTDEETMSRMVGEDNVTATDATQTHGKQLKVGIGPNLPPARAWVFSMKDEDRRMRIYIPNGTVTAVADTTFVANNGVMWDFTIDCNDDGTGHCIYLLTDDGVVSA